MKKVFIALGIIALTLACSQNKKIETAIQIDDIKITPDQFFASFQQSRYYNTENPDLKAFLSNFISRKLILKEAEKIKLDKQPEFLNDVQLFWEQSLLKRMLEFKIAELSKDIKVTDQEIREYYEKNKEAEYPDTDIADVYPYIRWTIYIQKQQNAIDNWTESLRKKANVKINTKLLQLNKSKKNPGGKNE